MAHVVLENWLAWVFIYLWEEDTSGIADIRSVLQCFGGPRGCLVAEELFMRLGLAKVVQKLS